MILSTRGRYAVMALVDLATHGQEGPVSLAVIAGRQEIPLAYLEQIFSKLRKGGLVSSVRGPGGGYCLAHPAGELCIAEIIVTAEEAIKMTRCEGGPDVCMTTNSRCLTHDLWEGLSNQIYQYLNAVTLEDVCTRRLRQKFPDIMTLEPPEGFSALEE